jgi:polyisoprenoid-binding protein YceI
MRIGPADGVLQVRTGVAGSAAALGHDLVLVVDDWELGVRMRRGVPASIALTAELASLRVESGSGGIKPLTAADRDTIRRNALGALHAREHPQVTFQSSAIRDTADGLHVEGTLTIHGSAQPLVVDVAIERGDGRVRAHCEVHLRQADFGVKPYSAMLGQLRVADEVRVEIGAEVEVTL